MLGHTVVGIKNGTTNIKLRIEDENMFYVSWLTAIHGTIDNGKIFVAELRHTQFFGFTQNGLKEGWEMVGNKHAIDGSSGFAKVLEAFST